MVLFFLKKFSSTSESVYFSRKMTKVRLDNGQLVYSKFEGGSKILLAFHGFGQDKSIFKEWAEILKAEYTIYSFDLFYHGMSDRSYGKLLKSEWKQYFEQFLKQEAIDGYSVMGFSLGGRFAIASSLVFPERTERLMLIAPDGIVPPIWFTFATHPAIKWLFKYLMFNPDKLDRLITFNRRHKIVSPYIEDFVKKELGDAENRKRVYISWNHFKTLAYPRRTLIKRFNQHRFDRQIVLGSNDHVIKPKVILPIIEAMGNFDVDILPMKHHQLVKPEVATLLK